MKRFTTIAFLLLCSLAASAQWGGAGWYRVHNTNNSSNKNYDSYISVVGDQANFDTGNTDQRWFYGCIRMRKPGEEISDPGTIIYVNALSNTTLSSQGLSTYQITKQYLSIMTNGTVDGKPVYSPYKNVIIANMYLQVLSDYLLDPGRGDTYAKYWLEPITEENRDTYYFGVKPLNENIKDSNGNYWTTLYAGFAFKIPTEGGVEGAYTVEEVVEEDGKSYARPVKKWGRGQTVPRATPVLLQCTSTDPAVNVLIPTDAPNSKTYSGKNLLSGCYFNLVASHAKYGTYNIVTPNDQENYRVLNISSKGTIGFYKYSAENMSANKAWLDLSKASNAKKGSVYLDFDNIDDQTTAIKEVEREKKAVDNAIYDLQGRRVEHPTHGIYIVNGKKVIFNK